MKKYFKEVAQLLRKFEKDEERRNLIINLLDNFHEVMIFFFDNIPNGIRKIEKLKNEIIIIKDDYYTFSIDGHKGTILGEFYVNEKILEIEDELKGKKLALNRRICPEGGYKNFVFFFEFKAEDIGRTFLLVKDIITKYRVE